MRTVTYGAACSLDGFITGPDGELDWLRFSRDVQAVMSAYWAGVDTILMGRKTWETAAASPGDPGGGVGASAIRTYVVSRTLETAPAGAELIREDPGGFVAELKRQPGRGICVLGGSDLAASLLAAGVVDEVGMNVHPVLLGRGVPLFRDAGRRIDLELTEARTLEGGCVLATYRVRRDEPA